MKVRGELVKKLRKEVGLSQEKTAEKMGISQRYLSYIETGKLEMDIWEFIFLMEVLGHPKENFWMLYLDSTEYENYLTYRHLNKLLRDNKLEEASKLLPDFEKGVLAEKTFIKQFVVYVRIFIDREISPEKAIDELLKALKMTTKNYDETNIANERMTHNEVRILWLIANNLFEIGERDRAIAMLEAIIDSRENIRASEEDKKTLYPSIMVALSTYLGRMGKIKESIKYCEEGLAISKSYNSLLYVPVLIYNLACGELTQGAEAHVLKEYILEAYYCARAIGRHNTAEIIKNDAEKFFGIII